MILMADRPPSSWLACTNMAASPEELWELVWMYGLDAAGDMIFKHMTDYNYIKNSPRSLIHLPHKQHTNPHLTQTSRSGYVHTNMVFNVKDLHPDSVVAPFQTAFL